MGKSHCRHPRPENRKDPLKSFGVARLQKASAHCASGQWRCAPVLRANHVAYGAGARQLRPQDEFLVSGRCAAALCQGPRDKHWQVMKNFGRRWSAKADSQQQAEAFDSGVIADRR